MGYVKMNIYSSGQRNTGMLMLLPADNVIRVAVGGDDDIVVDYASGYRVSIDYNTGSFNESDVVRLKEAINTAGGNAGPAIMWDSNFRDSGGAYSDGNSLTKLTT
tara:strand:+ start:270 stop:584 length:315 start_codon:yes stop_codon:yes gene_type:complete